MDLFVALDFQTAFLEVGAGDERDWIKLRVGRQELEYGSGRLIDVREVPNVRLSFDGIFFAGDFLKETQPDRNLNYWALWAGYKF